MELISVESSYWWVERSLKSPACCRPPVIGRPKKTEGRWYSMKLFHRHWQGGGRRRERWRTWDNKGWWGWSCSRVVCASSRRWTSTPSTRRHWTLPARDWSEMWTSMNFIDPCFVLFVLWSIACCADSLRALIWRCWATPPFREVSKS